MLFVRRMIIDTRVSSQIVSERAMILIQKWIGTLPNRTELTGWIYQSNFMLEAVGTANDVAEVAEQFGWLVAALRSSPNDKESYIAFLI
jgi:hypothetical protein